MNTQRDLFVAPTDSGAKFSDDRVFRYLLWRIWDRTKPMVFLCGLNPSVAAEVRTDPTITKETEFARRWGCGGLLKGNLYGFVSTDPAGLWTAPDPVGPENSESLRAAVKRCATAVVAWGATDGPAKADRIVTALTAIRASGLRAWCLGYTADGSPRHPSRIAYSTPMEPFEVRP